jgi:hypothetical protein
MARKRAAAKSISTARPDIWPREREGFSDQLLPAYAPVRLHPVPRRRGMIKAEKRIGFWIACAGFAYEAFTHQAPVTTAVLTTVPVLASATGIAMWLHAKWRRSIKAD